MNVGVFVCCDVYVVLGNIKYIYMYIDIYIYIYT